MMIGRHAINQVEINGSGVPPSVFIGSLTIESLADGLLGQTILSDIFIYPDLVDVIVGSGSPITIMSTIDYVPPVAESISVGELGELVLGTVDLSDFIGSAVASSDYPKIILTTIDLTPSVGVGGSESLDPNLVFTTVQVYPTLAESITFAQGNSIQQTIEYTPGFTSSVTEARDPNTVLGTILLFPISETLTTGIDPDIQLTTVDIIPQHSEILSIASGFSILGTITLTEVGVSNTVAIDPTTLYGTIVLSDASTIISSGTNPGITLTSLDLSLDPVTVGTRGILDARKVTMTTLEFTQVADTGVIVIDPNITLSSITLSYSASSEFFAIDPAIVQTTLEFTYLVSTATEARSVAIQSSIEISANTTAVVASVDPKIVLSSLFAYSEPASILSKADADYVLTSITFTPITAQSITDSALGSVTLSTIEFTLMQEINTIAIDPLSVYSTVDMIPDLAASNSSGYINQYFQDYDWLTIIPASLYQVIPTGNAPTTQFSSKVYSWSTAKSIEYVRYLTAELLSLQARGYVEIRTIIDIQNKASIIVTDNSGGSVETENITEITDFNKLRNAIATLASIHNQIRSLSLELSNINLEIRTQLASIESRLANKNSPLANSVINGEVV